MKTQIEQVKVITAVRRLGDGQNLCEDCLREVGLVDEAMKAYGWRYDVCDRCTQREGRQS